MAATSKSLCRERRTDLERLREEAGISLEQICDSTKISRRFLVAIEHGDYDQLPGGIFAINYVKQYAQAIGQDPAPLLAELNPPAPAALDPKLQPPPPVRKQPQRGMPSAWVRFFSLG